MAFTRAVAGLAALGTPAFALGHTRLFFGLLFGFMLVAAVIGLAWVPRLPKTPGPGQNPVSMPEPPPLADALPTEPTASAA
jgi:inositol transporter-like SP family MFS transporter